MSRTLLIDGVYDPAFKRVRTALEENLAAGDEIGETVAVVVNGKTVVDLWGGYKDRARTHPWARETLVCMFSVGKSLAVLPVLMLADRGKIDLSRPVTQYWPEFGQAGKEKITVHQLIAQGAAIPGAFAAKKGDAYHPANMVRAIESQEPLWAPGTQGCYHTFTLGYLCGELVRRVTGRTLGQFVCEEISLPLEADFHFGLSSADQRRCAEIYEAPGCPFMDVFRDPRTLLGRCWIPLPLIDYEEDFNTERFRASEMASFNGHGTARGVAHLFALMASGGALNGVRLLSQGMVDQALTEQWQQTDALGLPCRMGMGFMLRNEELVPYNDNPRSFGHIGLGGALACGDPDAKLGFSFAGNRMAAIGVGPYVKPLLDATMQAL
ncbi:MAG: beta-lactamase family protein [Deltaproteobacteria bacterium]|nr:beta-lactamase family protein [Deltaproteobacteria bacterium]